MRRFFIGSVGDPNEGYSKINLERCEKYHAHVMHKDTKCKGPFDDIKPTDIFFLKFEEKLLAFGEVLETKKLEDEGIDIDNGWTWHVVVKEWYWVNPNKVMNYGVKFNQIGGFAYDTIKEVKLDYGINKLREFNINNALYKQVINEFEMDKIIKLLKNNYNLILTSAPGTGKTYLAKEIAKAMGCTDDEIGFVQFHPSYDYTDFVEGLRPIQDGNGTVGFKRTDGVFKEFCKKALENWTEYENFRKMPKTEIDESKKTQEVLLQYFDYIENQLISQDGGMIDFLSAMKIRRIIRNKNGDPASIEIATSLDATTKQNLSVNVFCRDYIDFKNKKILSYRDVKPTYESTRSYHGSAYYYFRLYELVAEFERSKNFDKSRLNDKQDCEVKLKNFVFIIDEINRGEISKIFGELFFSIDPSYRGVDENDKPKGLVKTQYQNLVDEDDDFFGGFFVPENVYIIGTMNDIDRSVESMDFAFRRRFAFKEVTAKESQKMFDNDKVWDNKKPDVDKLNNRMTNLNNKISSISGLNSAYHIGGAYFLKLKYYEGEEKDRYNELWNNHLNGVLREYLRGNPKIEEYMKELRNAYDDESDHTKNAN